MEMFPGYSYDVRRLHVLSVVKIEWGTRREYILG
jgi:hypothetical protein